MSSNENNTGTTGQSILNQVLGERKAEKVKALKSKLKALVEKHEAAKDSVSKAEEEIRQAILDAGLSVEDVVMD